MQKTARKPSQSFQSSPRKNSLPFAMPSNHTAASGVSRTEVSGCQICITVLILLFITTGTILSIAATVSCQFLLYEDMAMNSVTVGDKMGGQVPPVPPGDNNTLPSITRATIGLVSWNPQDLGCTTYYDPSYLSPTFKMARVGGLVAACGGFSAIVVFTTELICCRFCCSKAIFCCLSILAFIFQAMTFIMYASDLCLSKEYLVYPCFYASGSTLAVFAAIFFLVSSILVCPSKKPKPLIKIMMDREMEGSENDPCCYCWRRREVSQSFKDPEQPPVDYPDEVFMASEEAIMNSTTMSSLAPRSGYSAPATKQLSFANAELVDDDLFFDAKTV